jgi:UPF0755 protein
VRLLKFMLVPAVGAALGLAFFLFLDFYLPYGPAHETFVEIPAGMSRLQIARQLQRQGVVRSALAFDALVLWNSLHGRRAAALENGEYRFDHPAGMQEVYDRIRRGDVYTVTLVIPEGFNIFDIANAVAAAGLDSRADFLRAEQNDTQLIAQWVPSGRANSLEGYLFPDTYKFSRHAGALRILSAMVRQFGVEARRLGMTPAETPGVVILASLVEKEVNLDAERPEVASVFANRLAAGMPLQTDPSVIYAALLRGSWTGVIHQSELKSDSAYNTYTHPDLPPGPICNPGVASLRAALHPARTDYLYFVADAKGATRFAATLAQHNANVAAYRSSSRH